MDKNSITELNTRIKLAEYIASNAGSLIKDLYHKKIIVREKEANDFVTELDKSIESMALKSILQSFPEDGFYGEENMGVESKNGYEWVIDPIDGTNNFVRGLPLCGFQLAILKDGVSVYGLIHRPLTQEIYSAIKGEGAFYVNNYTGHKNKLTISKRDLQQAVGVFDSKVGLKTNESTRIMEILSQEIASVRVFGVAVFDLPAVAEGSVEFLVTGIAKKYDLAAGLLLIEEAGGESYSPAGNDISLDDSVVIFSSKNVRNQIVSVLKS